MIKYLLLTIALLVAALILTARSCTTIRSDRNRLSDNQAVLFSEARAYAVRDSLSALGQGVLRMELDELRHARAKDAQLIADMGVRLRRVNSVAKIATIGTYEIKAVMNGVNGGINGVCGGSNLIYYGSNGQLPNAPAWEYRDQWIDFRATRPSSLADTLSDTLNDTLHDTLNVSIAVRDTIVQVLHRVPRFKFLGIWFGTRGVRQEIISKNPHASITAAEFIEIIR